MQEMILRFAPDLANYPFLMVICELLFTVYFGGIMFNELWGLLRGYRRY